jgi:protein-L-isoaspartate O-methyltransferase
MGTLLRLSVPVGALLALGACELSAPAAQPTTAGSSSAAYPPADRPVAEIVSSTWNDPAKRDRAKEAEQLVAALGIKPGMTVADVGAGSGYHTVRLSPVVGRTGRVLAQDVNGPYLRDLEATIAQVGLTNVSVVRGAPDDPRLPARSTDVALLVHMYHEIQSPYAFMARLAEAMKPGGRVGIVDLDRPTHYHGTPPTLLRCELTAVGYVETSFKELQGDIGYVAVFTAPAKAPDPAAVTPCRNPNPR